MCTAQPSVITSCAKNKQHYAEENQRSKPEVLTKYMANKIDVRRAEFHCSRLYFHFSTTLLLYLHKLSYLWLQLSNSVHHIITVGNSAGDF